MNYYNEIKNVLVNNEVNRTIKNYSINKSNLNAYYNVGKLLLDAGNKYGEDDPWTMGSSGCGPTAEPIIASAYNGKITPETTRADIVK